MHGARTFSSRSYCTMPRLTKARRSVVLMRCSAQPCPAPHTKPHAHHGSSGHTSEGPRHRPLSTRRGTNTQAGIPTQPFFHTKKHTRAGTRSFFRTQRCVPQLAGRRLAWTPSAVPWSAVPLAAPAATAVPRPWEPPPTPRAVNTEPAGHTRMQPPKVTWDGGARCGIWAANLRGIDKGHLPRAPCAEG